MNINQAIFKAYDIRGVYPTDINEDLVYRIAQGYVQLFHPKKVALGRDVRVSGASLWEAAKNGLTEAGVDVVDIGVISTDMLYFAVANYGYDGGITISASHNPAEYNGMKLVREKAIPISSDTGIFDIRDWVLKGEKLQSDKKGSVEKIEILDDYSDKTLSFLSKPLNKKYKLVVNANFGMAGIAFRNIVKRGNLPLDIVELNFEPDGTFPKGTPNPYLPENRTETIEAIEKEKPDFAIAWDGDADRIFFFDENSRFIDPYFVTVIQSKHFLKLFPNGKVLCDPRLVLAEEDMVKSLGGQLILSKSGHAFIKEKMREEDVIFGGEASGHYYYKDYFYADNGIIPFLILLQLFEEHNLFSDMFNQIMSKYFISGEINMQVNNSQIIMEKVKENFLPGSKFSDMDGITFEYPDWRFNLRSSNTEPLMRLNVESRDKDAMEKGRDQVVEFINTIK